MGFWSITSKFKLLKLNRLYYIWFSFLDYTCLFFCANDLDALFSFAIPVEFLLVFIAELYVLIHNTENVIDFLGRNLSGVLFWHFLNLFGVLHLLLISFDVLHSPSQIISLFDYIFENRLHYLVEVCMTRISRLYWHSIEDPIRNFLLIFKVEVDLYRKMLVVFRREQLIPEIYDADFLAKNGFGKTINGVRPIIGIILLVDFYRLPLFGIVKWYAFTQANTYRYFLIEDV